MKRHGVRSDDGVRGCRWLSTGIGGEIVSLAVHSRPSGSTGASERVLAKLVIPL